MFSVDPSSAKAGTPHRGGVGEVGVARIRYPYVADRLGIARLPSRLIKRHMGGLTVHIEGDRLHTPSIG